MEDQFDIDYERFKRDVKQLLGLDLNQYKPAQMKRRIKSFIMKYNASTLIQFAEMLRRDSTVLAAFKDFLTINVTEFFRNLDKFEELRQKVFPELIQKMKTQHRDVLRIWSAGCSTGAEAYTLAIIMSEYFRGVQFSILGTDIDATIIKNAKLGEYKDIEMKSIPKILSDKYFDFLPDVNKWRLKNEIKQNVKFTLSNLLEDAFSKGFDLILCRNVVIYFTEEAKEVLYKKFFDALLDGGVLFIGGTESILNAKEIGFKANTNLFYYK